METSPTSLSSNPFKFEPATSPESHCHHHVANLSTSNLQDAAERRRSSTVSSSNTKGSIVPDTDRVRRKRHLPSQLHRGKNFNGHHEPSPLPPRPQRSAQKGRSPRTSRRGHIETRGAHTGRGLQHVRPSTKGKVARLGMSAGLSQRVCCASSNWLGSLSSRHRSRRAVLPMVERNYGKCWRMRVTMQRCVFTKHTRLTRALISRSSAVLGTSSMSYSMAHKTG